MTNNKQTKTVVFRIQRGAVVNGGLQTKMQDYTVEYTDATTVLQGLEQIKDQQDGSLTYRRSCRASICGSCGMFINNRSRLACKTKIKDMVNGCENHGRLPAEILEIGPQKNQPVLKDLAVDLKPFYKKVHSIKPYIQEGEDAKRDVNKKSFEQVNMVSNCIMCGVCYSDCTALAENENYIGPSALAKAFRFVADPREGHRKDRLNQLSQKDGIWDCTRCGMCIDACPKDVAPMEAIMKLRTRAIGSGFTNNAGARHAVAFKNDIAKFGVLNEATLLLKTLHFGVLGQIGNAIHLAKKGKIPNPWPSGEVENLHEIKAMFDELAKNPINVETRAEDTGPGAG